MPSTITETEFAFRKCGALASNVHNPFAPIIQKPKELITSGLRHKIDTHTIVNRIRAKFGDIIDCPLQLIPKMESLRLTERQKAHYFKALYQALPELYKRDKDPTERTYAHMYDKYYKDVDISSVKPDLRNFIYSCNHNSTYLKKLYEIEYFKFSRFDSL